MWNIGTKVYQERTLCYVIINLKWDIGGIVKFGADLLTSEYYKEYLKRSPFSHGSCPSTT